MSRLSTTTTFRPRAGRAARRLAIAALAPAVLAAFAAAPATADSQAGCDRVAAPNGSDSAPGTAAAPLRTAQALADSLAPGQTGCLHAGTYAEDLRINHGGSAGAPLTLRSYPGERASIVGRLYIPHGSDYVAIASLDLNGTPRQGTNQQQLPSPTVDSDHATFDGDNVTNDDTLICFDLGNDSWGRATNVVIENSRIHNCGVLPSGNQNHGIYVASADNTQILNNYIYDNADRGIQLYPDAQGTVVRGNVIDGNGEGIIFSGDGGTASNNNDVEYNIISNSTIRDNVESWYPSGNPAGTGNVVRHNCLFGGRDGNGGVGDQVGFSVSDNLTVDPGYANRAAKDFGLGAGSPCASLLAGVAVGPQGQQQPQPPATPAPPVVKPTAQPPATTPIVVHHKSRHRGLLHLSGRVRPLTVAFAATAGHHRVIIQILRRGSWHKVVSAALTGNYFSSSFQLPRPYWNSVVRLRVVVPAVGSSATVQVHVEG